MIPVRIRIETWLHLRERKRARKARANSARQGVSSYWAKSGARCREMFGL